MYSTEHVRIRRFGSAPTRERARMNFILPSKPRSVSTFKYTQLKFQLGNLIARNNGFEVMKSSPPLGKELWPEYHLG